MLECLYKEQCNGCSLSMEYGEQLLLKTKLVKDEFDDIYSGRVELFKSKDRSFRDRAEFKLYHDGDDITYAMFDDNSKPVKVKECLIVSSAIANVMPKLLEQIKPISKGCIRVDFLTNGSDVLVDLIYSKKVSDEYHKITSSIARKLGIGINVISKKFRINYNFNSIIKSFDVLKKRYEFSYSQQFFTQPNGGVNAQLLNYVANSSVWFGGDLLELYTGIGNFSIVLANNFDNVLATEVNKEAIKVARVNALKNGVENIKFLRLSSEEFVNAYSKTRTFNRVEEQNIELDSYNFTTLLVDPPRAGLDTITANFAKRFENIIYISCNYKSLKRDLLILKEYEIIKMALFDQFAYTNHIETVVILRRNRV